MADQPLYMNADGQVLKPENEAEARIYAQAGYARADDRAVAHQAVLNKFNNPIYGVGAGLLASIPGATSVATTGARIVGGADTANNFAQAVDASKEASPWAAGLAQAGGILGVGLLSGGTSLLEQGVVRGGAALAASGAAMGAGMTADEKALEYAKTGAGSERIFADIASSAALGAVLSVTMGAAFAAAPRVFAAAGAKSGQVAQALDETATKLEMTSSFKKEALDQLARKGTRQEAEDFINKNKLFKMDPPEMRARLIDMQKEAKGLMNQARFGSNAKLNIVEGSRLTTNLQKQLAGTDPAVMAAVEKLESEPTLRNLHNMRLRLDKISDFNVPEGGLTGVQQQFADARDLVDTAIGDVLKRNGNPQIAKAWTEANANFRNATTLLSGLKKSEAAGTGFFANAASAGGAAAGAALGGPAGAAVGGTLARNLVGGNLPRAGAKVMRGFATVFDAFNSDLAKTIVKRLTTPAAAQVATQGALAISDYSKAAASIQLVAQQPDTGVSHLSDHLTQQGVPQQVIDAMVPYQQRVIQHLAEKVVKPPFAGQLAAPAPHQPSRADKAKLIDAINVVRNPRSAIDDPTPAKLETLAAIYPNLLAQVRDVVREEAATRPTMPTASKRWAGKILGMPGGPCDTLNVMLGLKMLSDQRDQALKLQIQQAGGSSRQPSGGGMSSTADASTTRIDRMARSGDV